MTLENSSQLNQQTRILRFLLFLGIYFGTFVFAYPITGGVFSALAIIPAAVAGWYLGIRGGVLGGIAAILTTVSVYVIYGEVETFLRSGVFGAMSLIFVALGFGWISTLLTRIREQAAALTAERAALQNEISERVTAEAARRESEDRLRAVLSNTPILLSAFDQDGQITLLEGRVLDRVTFSTPPPLLGKSIDTVFENMPDLLDLMHAALAGNPTLTSVKIHDIQLEIQFVPQRDADGNIVGYIGIATDITDRVQAEAALDEIQLDLARSNQQFARANESFKLTMERILDSARRGADRDELLVQLRQARSTLYQTEN